MSVKRLGVALVALGAFAGFASAQTTSPTQSPGSQGVTAPTNPNAPASQGGTIATDPDAPVTGGVSQGDLVNGSGTGASSGEAGQSNVPGETGSHEQDNRGVPAPSNTQGQD